ncbi:hypothetical protein DES53_101494 [Roseimicrobium gellanilyticum]|uniref:Uncharacterized protein n=1 Tax=Roseimicrobium gellanilyticum TaxID=748857 RepID=A0A366HW32_9BACT|nr:hypothetical protein [Roseimicrobium gellanilyticum]RBP47695.1 hypothetical protein DES53_101494 [Roseimicrobium gellanilyticum]
MRTRSILLLALSLAGVCPSIQGLEQVRFNIEGENPQGEGKYSGHVVIKEVSNNTATVQWTLGKAKEITDGVAIKTDSAVGAAYSGKPLALVSILEIKGDGIHGRWMKPAKLSESTTFRLSGSDFTGKATLSGGAKGTVTFTEERPSIYKVVWELEDGRHEGVGVRNGKVLVAASGDTVAGIGVAALVPKDEKFEGVWATSRSNNAGTETWTHARPLLGKDIVFGDEQYLLRSNQSAPGKGTSQLREYLREGDSWKGYSKLVALRLQHVDGNAEKVARAVLEDVKKDFPDAFSKEIESGPEGTTIAFVLSEGDQVEFNLWRYKDFPNGIASVQFVLRNKPPFADHQAFTAEQDQNLNKWLEDLKNLAKNANALLEDSGGMAVVEEKDNATDEGVVSATMKGDLDKCAETAKQFIHFVQTQQIDKAAALMSDAAFTTTSRQDFIRKITESNEAFGPIKSFKADKSGTSFTIEDDVMIFVIEADAEYENASVREALRFERKKQDTGGFQFVGYGRRMKQ